MSETKNDEQGPDKREPSVDRSTAHRCWSIDLGGVLVDVQTTDSDWLSGEDIDRWIAFEWEIERALRRLVGPMKSAVQGSMFDEVNDDDD
jgi:hypothetical protein